MEQPLLKVEDVARLLSVSTSLIYGYCRDGTITPTMIGSSVRVSEADLAVYLERCRRRKEAEESPRGVAAKILDCVGKAGKPLHGKAIALRCGQDYNGHFRSVLAGLAKSGRLSKQDDGYSRAA